MAVVKSGKTVESDRRTKKTRTTKVAKPTVTVIPEAEPVSSATAVRKTKPAVAPGGAVVYVGRIPHGFYENEMRAYFAQFGEITRLRLSRNRVTGASKHYAFVEFRHAAVADVVAETMNNYLLFNQLLQCRLVPSDKVHPEMFKGANRKFRPIDWQKRAREQYNAELTEERAGRVRERAAERRERLQTRLKDLGIKYECC